MDAYHDRKYGDDQASGFMDVTMATTSAHVRATDISMPPSNEFPGTSGSGQSIGDYDGLAVGSDGVAHPVWADTRNPIFVFDDSGEGDPRTLVFAGYGTDVYTASISIELKLSGRARKFFGGASVR